MSKWASFRAPDVGDLAICGRIEQPMCAAAPPCELHPRLTKSHQVSPSLMVSAARYPKHVLVTEPVSESPDFGIASCNSLLNPHWDPHSFVALRGLEGNQRQAVDVFSIPLFIFINRRQETAVPRSHIQQAFNLQ